jgi:hypothetical protein
MEAVELIQRVTLVRLALDIGDITSAHRQVVELAGELVDELVSGHESAAPPTGLRIPDRTFRASQHGVQTSETALDAPPDTRPSSARAMRGPSQFVFIVVGEVEGDTRAQLYSSCHNESERERLLAWMAGPTVELAVTIATLLKRFRHDR